MSVPLPGDDRVPPVGPHPVAIFAADGGRALPVYEAAASAVADRPPATAGRRSAPCR